MTETDSIRLARVEEKLDALIDKLEERCAARYKTLESIGDDVDALKQDRAKLVGIGACVGAVLTLIGNAAMKLFTFTGGK